MLTLYLIFLIHRVYAADNVPPDSILLDCGTETEATGDRTWKSNFGSEYAASDLTASTSLDARAIFMKVAWVPYGTARIFKSEFTYSFPVSAGWKYIRLHFCSASYGNLSSSNAIFSVSSGGYTLLRDFSVSQNREEFNITVKEFSINVAKGRLNITFTPSSNYNNSYALVNGIEVIPMPDIYNGSAIIAGEKGVSLIVSNTTVLEKVLRLNVGGTKITPAADSGLFRSWSEDDFMYLPAGLRGEEDTADSSLDIKYFPSIPSYVAPKNIYRTARTMGSNQSNNQNNNLTWGLLVDPGFHYLLRLHFCEINSNITKVNQRVFQIILNNHTVEDHADVVAWTGNTGNGIALYKDYAVHVPKGGDRGELLVELHPNIASKPEYYDAILNGLEIFKVNDTTGNLAGPPAFDPAVDDSIDPNFPRKSGNQTAIIAGVTGGLAALCLLGVVVFAGPPLWLMHSLYGNSHPPVPGKTNATQGFASSLSSDTCRHFSFDEIKAATSNFNEALILGVGGFGKVYKGEIENGTIKVAIKRGNPLSDQGVHAFQTEIELLSKLRHRHLVSLIGYCEENCEMILVYDYMALGTLREHLYKTKNPPLLWKQRLEICIGAARGLHYLHTGAKPQTIIHRDVKTTNILLDDKWVAKVSDFGLSKLGPSSDHTHVTTAVKGSFGYLDPEYFRRRQITEKSDVYSFGVVLFEVLCAKPALNPTLADEEACLAEWALQNQREGNLDQIIDPYLNGKIASECLKTFAEISEKCLNEKGIDRPSMGDVLWSLEYALQLQENMEGGGGVHGDMDDEETSFTKDPDAKSSGFSGSGNNSWSSELLPR
ncbi:hypothetical protein MKW98_021232 [Papaver atlanticum]|uniref:non-specific serine/threonine protein kinase n=1 Tax=Papaver atlanticum TaxID=357466 RepID=A0AAD4S9B9_9MAGN|nr:hypothetical protein MKW98_021232 [Papaver atlanticum]